MESADEIEVSEPKTKLPIFRIFLRSFFLQTLMNYTRMQGLGFGMALIPVAKTLKLKGWDLSGFLRRHLEFFNAHPYFATYVLGAVARMRSEEGKPAKVMELKRQLIGPLGLLGDEIFWSRLKPLFSGLTVFALMIVSYPPSPKFRLEVCLIIASALVLYNFLHFYVRWTGMKCGDTYGKKVLQVIPNLFLVRHRYLIGLMTASAAGLFFAKTTSLYKDTVVFFSAFSIIIISRYLKSPLWLTLVITFALSIFISFISKVMVFG